ncbi:hypothetical protein [Silvania hatchlandensis]|uniref:Uncharacterized protein n=1 Tax=Silvania hatchlandensis TaxID=2926469 RepID=A0A9J6Q332_9ENTR|nr:hypothetical protein [Silvania hatchlandensis]MCU6666104.1 hypothetical protein [Silvania hatchlandensis]
MNNKVWDGKISSLPAEFKTQLLGMLDRPDVIAVRLGITGKGIQPNYQLIHVDNSVTTMNGANHKKFERADEFDETNITAPLTRCDITTMILTGQ